MTAQMHEYTVPLYPTPEQARALVTLGRALSGPCAPTVVAGEELLMPATPDGLSLVGVPGVVRLGVDHLPPWAAQVWRWSAGGDKPTLDPQLGVATVEGRTYIERGDCAGTPGWLVDVVLRWDAYATGQLVRDGDERSDDPERRAVRHLMR